MLSDVLYNTLEVQLVFILDLGRFEGVTGLLLDGIILINSRESRIIKFVYLKKKEQRDLYGDEGRS